MPLLGMPAHHIAKAGQLNLLYQYWIHTETIDKLPAPGWISQYSFPTSK